MALQRLSIPPPKASAEHALVFGCYAPFSSHARLIRSYTRVLGALGVDYTFLENEYCCGSPLVQTTRGEDRERAKEAVPGFLGLNVEQAIEKNAGKIAYFCSSCARIANSASKDTDIEHTYLLDLILDHLTDRRLHLPSGSMDVGYFEGCHATIGALFINAILPWERYRESLDRIDGLRVVDLPGDICCRRGSGRIFESLIERDLSVIVSACNNCARFLEQKSDKGVQVKHMVEIIEDALKNERNKNAV
jgi:Fe-S oxidoreductase